MMGELAGVLEFSEQIWGGMVERVCVAIGVCIRI